MGFFNRKNADPPANMPYNVRMWERQPYKGIAKMRRTTVGKLYVYYPEVLQGVGIGQNIVLEAFPGHATLRSSYNGTEVDTERDDTLAWMFKGRIVGTSRYAMEDVTRLLWAAPRRGRRAAVGGLLERLRDDWL